MFSELRGKGNIKICHWQIFLLYLHEKFWELYIFRHSRCFAWKAIPKNRVHTRQKGEDVPG